ncbi:MAG: TetR/AcrR family transcriptional regulator [Gammaproteobacteria bacterium]|nr:TetR/AcrR family transcriptional regulator [Gammaproteobacteria bacterium]
MTVAPKAAAAQNTRELLILTAERLFAEHGIDAVSLRQINTEAGQRNLSATLYHFGSKEALIDIIYDFRMERVNRRRLEILARIEAENRQGDVHALVEGVVMPIVEEVTGSEGGAHYIRCLAQVIGHPQLRLDKLWTSRHADGLSRIVAHLRRSLPELPAPLGSLRIGLMWEQIIHALADQDLLRENAGPSGQTLFVSNLIDVVAGGLLAPVGTATRRELKTTTRTTGTRKAPSLKRKSPRLTPNTRRR